MGKITNDELIELSQEVWSLLEDIKSVRADDSQGGKAITRREARKLLRGVLRLAAKIAIDILDD